METSRLASIIKIWAVWALVSVLVGGLDALGTLGFVRGGGERLVGGLNSVAERVVAVVQAPVKTWSFWRVGASRMADLEQRLGQMAVSQQEVQELRKENEELKKRFKIVDDGLSTKTMAKVVSNGEQLVIEKSEGVREGSVVVDLAGVLVGRVVRVGHFSAVVARPVDSGVKIAVSVGHSSGLVVGDGRSLQLTGVLQTEPLAEGNLVTTSGVDDQFPPGLVIGHVTEVMGKPADVTKGGAVELLAKVGERVVVFN